MLGNGSRLTLKLIANGAGLLQGTKPTMGYQFPSNVALCLYNHWGKKPILGTLRSTDQVFEFLPRSFDSAGL